MQGEVMEAVRRVQCESNKETCLQHDSEGTNHSNLRLCLNQSANDNGGDDAPFCHAETKSDTEDDFELIFANGRKYKRYFKRHIVFQRHVCKQIVVAPSLPDGSGPDLSRQVAQGPVQGCHFDNSAPRRETPTPTGSCQLSSSDDTESGLQATTEGEAASTSTSHSPRLWEPVGNGEKPRTPSASPFNNTLTNYMYKFGRSDPQDSGLESRIYRNFADFFHPKWCKRETAQGPHERSKTVAYVHKYSQPALTGPPIQHNTCVQETCTVRMVGGLNELRQQV
uniref:BTB/POZ domain-containing protein KCTD8 n=1 Tax=Mesocestoides corti TaxID=53468 RepID=A0A5K3FVJ3_MESCO